ncbi:unnamed protein product [Didymodactylos carnosus]|uniref:Uncharacterized protein n=1 Tax=Didymodactylos carnosus TaxID=1234261 RepID=A0A815WJA1_9BILA|nr:unnamed protein product [Didymodactylos carnosus]CAF4401954.1 unnamed protein product [Didymodactylos carnosus]
MSRFKCNSVHKRTQADIQERVLDLKNRVIWLKNVEYCLYGDTREKLETTKFERKLLENNNTQQRLRIKSHIKDNNSVLMEEQLPRQKLGLYKHTTIVVGWI